MPFSHHSHSGQFCKHASGSLDEVVQTAISKGFKVYGLTEHVPRYRKEDLYPEEEGMTPEELAITFKSFITEATHLRFRYERQISLIVGLETEYITSLDSINLRTLLEEHGSDIDYVVGSIHHVNAIPIDFDLATYQRAVASCIPDSSARTNSVVLEQGDLSTFFEAYFDVQYTLLTTHHPEVIGHFDLCRLYTPSILFEDFPNVMTKIRRNVQYAIDYGAVFELNAAALRKGWSAPFPGQDVFEIIMTLGGRFVLSDDSHGPKAVGLNYCKLFRFLREIGLKELYYLKRTDGNIRSTAGRNVQVVRVAGNWWEDLFWESLLKETNET